MTKNSPSERKEVFKYLDIASMESYGSEFLLEEKIYKQSLLLEADKYGCVKSEDNGLSLITIVDGHRLTVNQPQKFEQSCYLLGGSTIFNAQVPNELTIGSRLQQLMNSCSFNLTVQNFGVSGATSANRMKFMRENLILKPNDIVILYFGVNDICFPGQRDKKNNFGDLIIFFMNVLLSVCRRNFQVFNRLKLIQKPRFRRLTRNYLKEFVIPAIVDGSRFCKAKNTKFLAVLQPSLFSTVKSNDEEWKELGKLPKSLNKSLTFGNSLFVRELERYDFFVDGRSIFSETSEQVFCDWVHTTAKGNEFVARFFLKELLNRSWI
jgi:lysophospholipase L1-like esterase